MTAPPSLVCPACRHAVGGDLHVRLLTEDVAWWRCTCGARFPVLDGVPVIVRDLDAWLAGEGAEALRRHDLPPELDEVLSRGAGGALARNRALVDVYERSREGALQTWLRARIDAVEGTVLELGAGVGASARPDVVALDHNLALVRRHPGRRICGDAADPPFLPAAFDAVVLPNLLDSCADPALVLAQADALLRPGGRLVGTCAYAFHDGITPASRRFGPDQLRAALDGRAPFFGFPLAHRLVEDEDGVEWPLRVSERLVHRHAAHVFVSVKGG